MLDLDGAISILLRKKLLGEALLKEICEKTKELLMRESNVVHIQAPVTVVGDIHGSVPLLSSPLSCLPLLTLADPHLALHPPAASSTT